MKHTSVAVLGLGHCPPRGRLRPLRLVLAAAASVLMAQTGLATPTPASVMLTLQGNSWSAGGFIVPTVIEQANGPIVHSEVRSAGQFAGARTDYGVNGSAVSMWGTRPSGAPMTGHRGWTAAESKWTDQLTVYTPDVAFGAPVDLAFSIGLEGFIEGTRTDHVSLGGRVRYFMYLGEFGSWIDRPMLWHDLWENSGGPFHDRIDVNEVQSGRFTVPNGRTFNLISVLSTYVSGDFNGPWDTSFSVASSFGNTVDWRGGEVWVGNQRASTFTVTSASGFVYAQQPPSVVAEPSTLAQLALSLAALNVVLRRARTRAASGRRRRHGVLALSG